MNLGKSVAGRTAVVTGASSGIGRAIARRLGAEGAHVFLCGRTEAAMTEIQAEIRLTGGAADVVVADIREPDAVMRLVDQAVRRTGRMDIMVNNAGMSHPEPLLKGTPDQWRAMLETNVLALLVGCQAAVKAMRACEAEGHIVNISSIAAQTPDSGVYGATKHAVSSLSHTLRRELENDTIRVVNVEPGAISTNFVRHFDPSVMGALLEAAGVKASFEKGERLPDAVLSQLQAASRQFIGDAEDVADAVLYAVTRPIYVNIAEIVVRPPRQPVLKSV